MAYERRIIHYSGTPTTYVQELGDRATSAWFELLRLGGCGQGELELKDIFGLRDEIKQGDWIAFDYQSNGADYANGGKGDRWYFGRVENMTHNLIAGATISLFGMFAEMSEVFPGGFGDGTGGGQDQPHRYAAADYFPHDPDHGFQTWDQIRTPTDAVNLLYDHYIYTATHIRTETGSVETTDARLLSATYRGEETTASIIRTLGLMAKGASWGVDENGILYFKQKRTTVLTTFQIGVDVESLNRKQNRSLFYNRLMLTGDYIYGIQVNAGNVWSGFYRYRAIYHQNSSIAQFGEKRIKLYVPWIRRNEDSKQFATEFFRMYGQPTNRYTFTTVGQSTLIRPWEGQIRLLDQDGSEIVTSAFDEIRVQFDHVPSFTITLGPEDIQYPTPPEDQRWEVAGDERGDGQQVPLPSIGPTPTLVGPPVSFPPPTYESYYAPNEERAIVEGILQGALAASTDNGSTATTADLKVYDMSSGVWGPAIDTTTTAQTELVVEITNRNDDFSAESGDYLMAIKIGDEYRPVSGAGSGGGGVEIIEGTLDGNLDGSATVTVTGFSANLADDYITTLTDGKITLADVAGFSGDAGSYVMAINMKQSAVSGAGYWRPLVIACPEETFPPEST